MKADRILIFNVNWLGDALFSTAAIRNIRYNFPGSFIACVIPSRCYPVLKGNPCLDEIIIFDEKDRHRGLFAKLNFVKLLRSRRFDTVFLLHRSFSRALICFLAGIPRRFGYYTKKRGFLLTRKIVPPAVNACHRIDYYLTLLERAGLRIEDRYLEFFVSKDDMDYADGFLAGKNLKPGDFLVGINPGGNWLLKRWPEEYWARLCDALVREFGASVIITGSAQDSRLAASISSMMQEQAFSVCGIFNLKQLGALCKRLNLFITADTGPLHIANAVGVERAIAIFGPTCADLTGPYPANNTSILAKDTGCEKPCYELSCKDNRCMKAVTPEDVIEEIRAIRARGLR